MQKHLLAKSLEPTDRRQDVIHPSEMAKKDWCPRQTWYRLMETEPSDPRAKKFNFQLENIFSEGNDIHGRWQTWLQEMGRLWGRWGCLHCQQFEDASLVPMSCPRCGNGGVKYHEVPLESEEYEVAGHADGAIPDLRALIELKSVGMGTLRFEAPEHLARYQVETTDGKKIYDLDQLWAKLHRPFPSHVRQANIYLWLCQEMGLPFDSMIFLYEFKANQAVKEFTIKYSPDIVEPLLDKVKDILFHLREGTPPARPVHVDGPETSVCKSCVFRTKCWDLNETSEQDGADTIEGSGDSPGPGPAGIAHVPEAGLRLSGSAGRRDRAERPRPDEPVREADGLAGVHGDAAGTRGGGRKVRRVSTRNAQGHDGAGEHE